MASQYSLRVNAGPFGLHHLAARVGEVLRKAVASPLRGNTFYAKQLNRLALEAYALRTDTLVKRALYSQRMYA